MKKILFLEQFSNISGGQRVLLSILEGLDKKVFDFYVCIPAKGELSAELEKLGVGYSIIPIGSYSSGKKSVFDWINYFFRLFFVIPSLIRIIKGNKIDIIYCNAPRTFFFGALAAKFTGVKVVWHIHSMISGFYLKLNAFLAKFFVDKLIAVSNAVANPFLKEQQELGAKIEILYNGVDVKKYNVDFNIDEVKKDLNIPNDFKVVGFIGQVAKWKGIEDFIMAVELVLKSDPKIIFLVVGDVLFEGKKGLKYKDYLFGLIKSKKIEDKVLFLGKRGDIPRLLSIMDVFVLPSIEPDPCPLILLEAMAAGKAVIVTNHGGPSEILENNQDGVLYKNEGYLLLSEAEKTVLNSQDLRSNLGYNAKMKIEKHFQISQFQQKISNILKGIKTNGIRENI